MLSLVASLSACAVIEQDHDGFERPITEAAMRVAKPLKVRRVFQSSSVAIDSLPIGSIIAFVPVSTLRLPDGWMYCSGQQVTDQRSPLFGKAVPNLNDQRFLMGTVADAGAIGGSNVLKRDGSHKHGGNVETDHPNSNADVVKVGAGAAEIRVPRPDHQHYVSIEPDGAHDHGGDKRPAWAGVLYIVKIK